MNKLWKQILSAALILLLVLGAVACGGTEQGTAAPEATREAEKPAESTKAPTAEPTAEPTEAPTPEPTPEPEYLKYAAIREELMEKYATTAEAYEQIKYVYGLTKNEDHRGIFLVDWDKQDAQYNFYLTGAVSEMIMMAYYSTEDYTEYMKKAFFDPADAVTEAPGVLRVEHNDWLNALEGSKAYVPMYFISLESEDPASGCWLSLYRDLPEEVLHVAKLGDEELAVLEETAFQKELEESGVRLSEGELIIDGVDYAALRNQLIRTYRKGYTLKSSLYSKLDAIQSNPAGGKTPNGAFFINWESLNYIGYVTWYLDDASKEISAVMKKARENGNTVTADMAKGICYDPDKAEILADSIIRTTSNKWMKSGDYIIWISIESTDPHTGIWVGFYGPIPQEAWE